MKLKTLLRNSGLFASDHSSSGISSLKSASSSGELENTTDSTEKPVTLDSDDDFDKLSWSNFKINIELVSNQNCQKKKRPLNNWVCD